MGKAKVQVHDSISQKWLLPLFNPGTNTCLTYITTGSKTGRRSYWKSHSSWLHKPVPAWSEVIFITVSIAWFCTTGCIDSLSPCFSYSLEWLGALGLTLIGIAYWWFWAGASACLATRCWSWVATCPFPCSRTIPALLTTVGPRLPGAPFSINCFWFWFV